jgi:hypothetical protein
MNDHNFFNCTFHTPPFGAVGQGTSTPKAQAHLLWKRKISNSLQRPYYPTDKNPLPHLYVKWAFK